MRQCSAWFARWRSCARAAEISRAVSSEVRGGRCFLLFCADLSREHEEQTICLARTHNRSGLCYRLSAPHSYTNSVSQVVYYCARGMPLKDILGPTDGLQGSTVRDSISPGETCRKCRDAGNL